MADPTGGVCPGCQTPFPAGARFCSACARSLTPTQSTPPDAATGTGILPPPRPMTAGVVVDGKYEIRQRLGTGGFGDVFKVHHKILQRDLALKTLHAALVQDERMCERFFREARMLMDLQHPNIVHMREVGEWQGHYYLVMDFCAGETLESLLERCGRLPARTVAALALPVLRALDYAHAHGIVHRDLKPANLLLTPSAGGDTAPPEDVKVLDFGIAKVIGDRDNDGGKGGLTGTGMAIGTVFYMSPEQAGGDRDLIGPRSDLYSLGAVLFQAVTGRVPFDGENSTKIFKKIFLEPPPTFADLKVPDELPGFESLLRSCMAKEPAGRPSTAKSMIEFLEGLLRGDSGVPNPTSQRAARHPTTNLTPVRRPRTAVFAAASLVLVLPLVGAALGWFGKGDPAPIANTAVPAAKNAEPPDQTTPVANVTPPANVSPPANTTPPANTPAVANTASPANAPLTDAAAGAWAEVRRRAEATLPTGEIPADPTPFGDALRLLARFLKEKPGEPARTEAESLRAEWEKRQATTVAQEFAAALARAKELEASDPAQALAAVSRALSFRSTDTDALALEKRLAPPHASQVSCFRTPEPVRGVAFDPPGRLLAAACGRRIRMWDVNRGEELKPSSEAESELTAVGFSGSPNGAIVFSCSAAGEFTAWEVDTGKKLGPFLVDPKGITALATQAGSPGEHAVVMGGESGTVALFDPVISGMIRPLFTCETAVVALAISPDGSRVAAAGRDRSIRVWSLDDDREVQGIRERPAPILSMAFRSSTAELVIGDAVGKLSVCLTGTRDGTRWHAVTEREGAVLALSLADDDRTVVVAGADGYLKVWDLEKWKELATLPGHRGDVRAVAAQSRTGRIATASADRTIRIWTLP